MSSIVFWGFAGNANADASWPMVSIPSHATSQVLASYRQQLGANQVFYLPLVDGSSKTQIKEWEEYALENHQELIWKGGAQYNMANVLLLEW